MWVCWSLPSAACGQMRVDRSAAMVCFPRCTCACHSPPKSTHVLHLHTQPYAAAARPPPTVGAPVEQRLSPHARAYSCGRAPRPAAMSRALPASNSTSALKLGVESLLSRLLAALVPTTSRPGATVCRHLQTEAGASAPAKPARFYKAAHVSLAANGVSERELIWKAVAGTTPEAHVSPHEPGPCRPATSSCSTRNR
jgi:hypothetical protein